MIGSKNTNIYLENLKKEGIAKTEAFKTMTKKAAKLSALYGSMAVFVSTSLGLGAVLGVTKVQDFFRSNEVVFAMPVELRTNKVVTVKPIEKAKTVLVENTKAMDEIVAKEDKPTISKKVCDKWGVAECKTALAVAKAEGLSHPVDDWNGNTDGSFDTGYFRINSSNFSIKGCSHAEVVTEDGNINCAYIMWDRADGKEGDKRGSFSPWVAFWTGKYLAHL